MSTRDLFQRGGSPGSGGGSGGGPDEFKRQVTGPLGQRVTRPLSVNPIVLEQEMQKSREMLELCQIIIQRFESRMAILGASIDQVSSKVVIPLVAFPRLDAASRRFAERVAVRLQNRTDLHRRAVIAYTQFFEARQAIRDVVTRFGAITSLPLQESWDALLALEIPKLQGRLYPLTNLYETFRDDELLAELFPPAK
jgi:hypothetical protein